MRRSTRTTTKERTGHSKRMKKDRDLKKQARSATGVVKEKEAKLKRAILEGFSKTLRVSANEIPTSVTLLIWEYQRAEQKCARQDCPILYFAVHTHEEAKWKERDGGCLGKFFFHETCAKYGVGKRMKKRSSR